MLYGKFFMYIIKQMYHFIFMFVLLKVKSRGHSWTTTAQQKYPRSLTEERTRYDANDIMINREEEGYLSTISKCRLAGLVGFFFVGWILENPG